MLVLVSFGLVLVASVLLVIGLIAGSGLALIYLSIACSVVAGIVLVVATRVGDADYEPAGPVFGPRPASPTGPQPAPAGAGAGGWAGYGSGPPGGERPAPAASTVTAPMPAVGHEHDAAGPPSAPMAPAAAVPVAPGAGEGDDGEADFPIADYDDLRVAEILPLLPELYEDELDVVEERELAGKGRVSVLSRLVELRALEPAPEEEEAAVAGAPPEGDGDEVFPIADYDDLRVAEILPLLPELYEDELDVVEERELAGKSRVAVLDRLADLRLSAGAGGPGELEAEQGLFPIADYDELRVAEVLPLLAELYDDELDMVEERERAGKSRVAVLDRLTDLRRPAEPEPEAPVAGQGFFPIADYDDLRVAEILPLLSELDDDELDEVRAHEVAGGNRKTVLGAIDRRLPPPPPPPPAAKAATKARAKRAAPAATKAAGTSKKASAGAAGTAKKASAKTSKTTFTVKQTAAKATKATKKTAAKATKQTAAKATKKKAPARKSAARR